MLFACCEPTTLLLVPQPASKQRPA